MHGGCALSGSPCVPRTVFPARTEEPPHNPVRRGLTNSRRCQMRNLSLTHMKPPQCPFSCGAEPRLQTPLLSRVF